MRLAAAATVLTLSGCAIEYVDGMNEQGKLHCKLLEACDQLGDIGYTEVKECIADSQRDDWSCSANYDPEAMDECISGWETAVNNKDCEASPPACLQVCR